MKKSSNNNIKYKFLKNEDDSDFKKNDINKYLSETSSDHSNNQNIEVINPLYNIDSYLDINKNNNNNEHEHRDHTEKRNSLLNVLTKTLRTLVNKRGETQNVLPNKRVVFDKLEDSCQIENELKIDEISLNDANDRVQLTLHLPTSFFTPEDIELFKRKKRNSSINGTYTTCSSDDEQSVSKSKPITTATRRTNRKKNKFNLNRNEPKGWLRDSLTNLNKKKTSFVNLNDYSLNSLSTYNASNRNTFSSSEINFKKIIFLIILTFLINPITGRLKNLAKKFLIYQI